MKHRIRAVRRAVSRGLWLAGTAVAVGLPLLIGSLVAVALIPAQLGEEATPAATRAVRAFAGVHRRFAWRSSGARIDPSYRTDPTRDSWRPLLRDPATWRDLAFLLVNTPTGLFLGLLPACLAAEALLGIVAAPIIWASGSDSLYWQMSIPMGLIAAVALIWLGPWSLRWHALIASTLLGPGRGELADRLERLRVSRAEVVDTSAAELRRIERDLHDGAQARLVALGMTIGLAEHLVRTDPEAAAALLAEARDSNSQTLTDLRDLVRGILPPVLADRGLDGAIRALTVTLPIQVTVDIETGGPVDRPIEAAVYFALAEALANVVKHSGATQAWVRVRGGTRLVATVGDNGTGGAVLAAGGGLAGIQRRLDAFDGRIEVTSPPGGPTIVAMEVPCAS